MDTRLYKSACILIREKVVEVQRCMTVYSSHDYTSSHLGMNISLSPSDVKINESQIAIFRCNYSCVAQFTHTMVWLVGDQPIHQRFFFMNTADIFSARSGLHVEVRDLTSCPGSYVLQELRINASSAQLFNRTAVQCFASRISQDHLDFYSPYGIMLVNEKGKGYNDVGVPAVHSKPIMQKK